MPAFNLPHACETHLDPIRGHSPVRRSFEFVPKHVIKDLKAAQARELRHDWIRFVRRVPASQRSVS